MKDYDAKNSELRKELAKHYPNGAKMCDPFSGRAMISLEARSARNTSMGASTTHRSRLLRANYWLNIRCATGTTNETCRLRLTSSTRPSTSLNRDSCGMCDSCLNL